MIEKVSSGMALIELSGKIVSDRRGPGVVLVIWNESMSLALQYMLLRKTLLVS